ncbi:MAG: aminopeptidase P family protein [Spirochaetales bacterium]|nr:aminopeptidase P family protein [Spirochaetales bacterium]
METGFREGVDKDLLSRWGVDALLVAGADSLVYLFNLEFPFSTQFPEKPVLVLSVKGRDPLLYCPFEFRRAALDQGWKAEIVHYSDGLQDPWATAARTLSERINASGAGGITVGCELRRIPEVFFAALREGCGKARWKGIDGPLDDLRSEKSPAEVGHLKEAAEQLEYGLVGALQHLEGSLEENGYTLAEFCERIRVHVYESGGTASGLSAAAAGTGKTLWYSLPRGKFIPGELVRLEASSRYKGWWAVTSRMITLGEADALQQRSFRENMLLRNRALELLVPGTTGAEIFHAVHDLAASEGIPFRDEFGLGHGIGTAERESPFLSPDDDTKLREGMCLVLAVYTEGPGRELICVKDTYCLQAAGPLCLSAYFSWDTLYEVTGFRSAH